MENNNAPKLMRDLIEEIIDVENREAEYQKATWSERCAILKQFYADKTPEIMREAGVGLRRWGIDPYAFDLKFNRNEQAVWGSIRRGLVVMYPEFPVLGYFVDFGNPFLRLAIEADSEKYHDRQKDTLRDGKLLDAGWKVFRVQYHESIASFVPLGEIAEIVRSGDSEEASRAMQHWLLQTSDGVVDAIDFFYFMSEKERLARMEQYPEYLALALRTLKMHRLVEFSLPSV